MPMTKIGTQTMEQIVKNDQGSERAGGLANEINFIVKLDAETFLQNPSDRAKKIKLSGGMSGRPRDFELTTVQQRLSRLHNSVAVAAGQTMIKLKRENCAVKNKKNDESPVTRQGGKIHADGGRDLITRHGFPAATTFSGTSLVTTEHAPTTLCAPIVTPGKIKARAPTKASSPMVILAATSGISGRPKSWVPLLR